MTQLVISYVMGNNLLLVQYQPAPPRHTRHACCRSAGGFFDCFDWYRAVTCAICHGGLGPSKNGIPMVPPVISLPFTILKEWLFWCKDVYSPFSATSMFQPRPSTKTYTRENTHTWFKVSSSRCRHVIRAVCSSKGQNCHVSQIKKQNHMLGLFPYFPPKNTGIIG